MTCDWLASISGPRQLTPCSWPAACPQVRRRQGQHRGLHRLLALPLPLPAPLPLLVLPAISEVACASHHLKRPPLLLPAGYEDKELRVECSQRGLLVQSQGSPPLIDRLFDHSVDPSRAVETFRSVYFTCCLTV
jgi:hypothetical protein